MPVRWLAFGTYDVDRHPRVGALIEGLRAAGDEVVEINAPLGLDTAERVRMLQQPWRLPLLAVRLARCWWQLAQGSRRARSGAAPDAVLVGYLGHFDVHLARLLFRRTPLVLDHLISAAGTARDRGLAGSAAVRHRLLASVDASALARADVVVVDTPQHERRLPAGVRPRAVVVPVGATGAWFAAARALPAAGAAAAGSAAAGGAEPLRVVFVGLFTPLHGTPTIGRALAALGHEVDLRLTMVGRGQDHEECRALVGDDPRVTWVDWVEAADLPGVVAAHDVSLGIFGTTDKALDVVPTKVYQGAAAGCVVLTSDTPPQRAALDGAAVLVPPGDPAALAAALARLAADRDEVRSLRAAARDRAVRDFTSRAVVEGLRARVARLLPAGTAGGTGAPGAAGAVAGSRP